MGKTTTAVNLAACAARDGGQVLLVDLDPQCNATVALGLDRDAPSVVVRVPERRRRGRDGGAARRPRQPLDRPREPRPGRRVGRVAACRGLRAPASRRPRPGSRAVRRHAARLPAVARAGDRQRAHRRRPGDRPGPGRVPGARGPRPVPRDARDDPPVAQPAADSDRRPDHDVRRAHAAGPRRRGRVAKPSTRTGVRYRDPEKRPPRRGSELRRPGDRARSRVGRSGRLPEAPRGASATATRRPARRWRREPATGDRPRPRRDPARERESATPTSARSRST